MNQVLHDMIRWGEAEVTVTIDGNLLVNIASLLLTIASFLYAVDSRRKMRTAQQAAELARKKLLIQRAVDDFDGMARAAADLTRLVRSRDWKPSAELATVLWISLAKATGSWPNLLKGSEKNELEVASNEIKSIMEMIPVDERTVEVEQIPGMVAQCDFVIKVLGQIAGRLKYLDEG